MRAEIDLVRRGVVSSDDFIAAIERQHEARPPLGQIAIEERLLSPRQVREVLHAQGDSPHLRFGELAIQLGFMNIQEVGLLLLKQQEAQRPLMNHLVDMGCINEQDAHTARTERRWLSEQSLQPA